MKSKLTYEKKLPNFTHENKFKSKSPFFSDTQKRRTKKSVLRCPAAIGPVQIVADDRLAKVLLTSKSIEGEKQVNLCHLQQVDPAVI